MRDPLHWMPVKHKLALAFGGLCLLAFGVGGFLISRSARQALEDEIGARIELECRVAARALNDGLELLGRRTEDFASDGYLRERVEALLTAGGEVEHDRLHAELESHLRTNKLPLVAAFVGLTLISADGDVLVHVGDGGTPVSPAVIASCLAQPRLWHSDLLEIGVDGRVQVISTPLLRLRGGRALGRLVSWVDPEVWVASSLSDTPVPEVVAARSTPLGLHIEDRSGRSLGTVEPADETGARRLRQTRPTARSSEAWLADEYPVHENGWTVNVRLSRVEAFAPVSGLQSRFLGVGLVLALLCAALLFFPMRFLVRPLGELREAARRIQSGDYSARVDVASADEVGDLARSFNHMAEAVDQKTQGLRRAADEVRGQQRELRQQHERLDTVIRSLRDGLIVLDGTGKPVLSNAAARPLLEMIVSGDERLASRYPCGAPDPETACAACLACASGQTERCVLDVGKQVFEVHGATLPPDADGRCGRVLVARDITERIEQDEQEIHHERLSVLGEVAAVMAHELNNPLTSIRMFAQMLADTLPGDSPYREHAEVIIRNTETCRQTIGELLGYATASAPEATPVSVHGVIDDVLRFVRPLAERAHAELSASLAAEGDVVHGDEIQIRQLLVNLVMNALQAAGGEPVVVTITTRNDDGAFVAEVADTGPGVPAGVRDRVFDAFFSTKPRGEGTGLGLPTARRIAELHGGSLELAHTEPGCTTFRVRLRTLAAVGAGRAAE